MKNYFSWLKQYLKDPLQRNALFLMTTQVVGAVLGFLFWLIAARLYSAEEIGLATALISAVMLIAVLSILGYDVGLIRFLHSEENKRDMINTCLTIAGLLSIAIAITFISGLNIWSPKLLFLQEKYYYIAAFILFTIVTAVGLLKNEIFVAFRQTHFVFIQSLISGLRLLLVVLLVGFGAFGIFASFFLVSGLALVAGILFIVRIYPPYRPVPVIRKRIVKKMSRFSLGNYVARSLEALPIRIMPLLVIGILTVESSAYFYIAFSLSSILGMIAGSTSKSLFAEGSYQPGLLRSQMLKAVKFISTFLIPGILILFFIGDKFLALFGNEYTQNSFWLLRFLALSWLPATINMLYISIIRVRMKIKPLIYIYAFTAIFIIGISYLLMNWIGLIGVGIAWLLTQSLVAMVVGPVMLKMAGISAKSLLRIGGDNATSD
ncbi:lipopolysaccharide biosynthesis protein [Chloroflexota bacterium]